MNSLSTPTLASLLLAKREVIVARFVDEVQRNDVAPPSASPPLLVDHIPKFLDEIAAALVRVGPSGRTITTSPTARRHGEQRWTLGYDLQSLVREYDVLRHCIYEIAKLSDVRPSVDEFDVLARCLSVGVSEAVTEYVRHSEGRSAAQKANLEFIEETGRLLTSSLDYRSTLNRLTALVVPRMADWCVIHLAGLSDSEMPIAHSDPAKVAILRDLIARFPPRSDSPHGHRHVMRTGEAQIVATVDHDYFEKIAQNAEHLNLLRSNGCCSFIVVPLSVQANVFGTMVLGYGESQRHYAEDDLVVAREVARHAAVAIDNARLYQLSQDERSRVEAAIRAKDEFLAMVSHELRTPLNSILGWVRLLRTGAVSASKRDAALETIERNASAQSHLVADLLDVSRVIRGQIRISPATLNFGDVVTMAIEALRPTAEAKGIEVHVDVELGDATMRGDVDRLQQVVWNLVSNALKFTPKKGVVHVRVRRVESELELLVEDNGVGIPPDFLPHVFEIFRQAEGGTTRLHGGLGVGLSIAKHIVELHGGTIEAESEGVGQGALFRVRVPIQPFVSTTSDVPHVAVMQDQHDAAETGPVGLEGTRVLVVDDEPDARELLAYVLEAAGIEVRTASSAAEALEALHSFSPHVIVSDIGMPSEDGYALIRTIRMLPLDDEKRVPAIALTAFASHEDRARALTAGFNVHMTKPVEPTELVQAIAELVGKGTAALRGP